MSAVNSIDAEGPDPGQDSGRLGAPESGQDLALGQLVLDLFPPPRPNLANFVPGGNREALATLFGLAHGDLPSTVIYLWGPPGSGKTHLLEALAQACPEEVGRFPHPAPPAATERDTGDHASPDAEKIVHPTTDEPRLMIVDDVERLDAAGQVGLFALINRQRARRDAAVVAAGQHPPLGLALREDLRSRLGWGLVYGLVPLSDEDKALALQTRAGERGVMMSADVVPYLLTHTSRDMRQLISLFDGLDRLALRRQRAITVPLVREMLQAAAANPPPES